MKPNFIATNSPNSDSGSHSSLNALSDAKCIITHPRDLQSLDAAGFVRTLCTKIRGKEAEATLLESRKRLRPCARRSSTHLDTRVPRVSGSMCLRFVA